MHRRRQPPCALGETRAEAFARRPVISTSRTMPRQSPQPKGTPTSRLSSQPRSSALGHERQRDAHRDRVHPEQVAEVVGENERLGFEIPSIGPSAKIVLVLGIFAFVPANSPSAIA